MEGDQEVRGAREEHTFDDHEAAFLTPRLSIFSGDTQTYTAPQGDYSGGHDAHKEEPMNLFLDTEELQDTAEDNAMLFREHMNGEGETIRMQQGGQQELNATEDGDSALDAGVFFVGQDDNDADSVDVDSEGEINVETDETALDPERLPYDDVDDDDDDDGGNAAPQKMVRVTFPLPRVRELLKFHSDFSIVAKDAAVVAGEAVVLMLQDLTRLAAAEAERHRRKRVTYADIARVVHYFDRYSFLADAVPSAQEVASVAKTVTVGPANSSLLETPASCNVAREGAVRPMLRATGSGGGGAGMRQTKLRF
ncbi:hypothetical protein TraAM80_01119 [Trypanosoma rangeli]|uniref:Transcription factor CBF/NF-Y/archaeal histone domain-containing protein n=1 Tax=Trypanosoma rangeli TaxID=5698 RepID=A0A422P0E4_TRYRA|nr:uncharacterized protein TraAM80_01119 [Trypanosoma rangeli]RNF11187.1 hypothetical protein TraAM80_01119 [Trypanosoma rangeli]|eukprot:RNF11187.1 hypothetical protein TraAM80_01119 [Trypanosoma rangeli]